MWTKEMFHVEKPVIALLHLDPLPGDPWFGGSMSEVVKHAAEDLNALQTGGVDGILVANEFSMPYTPDTEFSTVAAMARIIGELKQDISVPFGVNIPMAPIATLDLAAATDAQFCRNSFAGAYTGDYGLYVANFGSVIRRKKALGLDDLKLFLKVNAEADSYLAERDFKERTRGLAKSGFVDGLCISGGGTGEEADSNLLKMAAEVADGVPVIVNTGCNASNVREKFKYADMTCMGTGFKKDGKLFNHVDVQRVKDFMEIVKDIRAHL